MIRILTYLLLSTALLTTVGCKKPKSVADGRSGRGANDVEPADMRPNVDTRFQEKFFAAQLEKSKGNVDKAAALFEECLKIDPKAHAIHYELGRIELEVRNHSDEALKLAKTAVEGNKSNPWYHLLLGDVYMSQSEYEYAIKSYREVAKLNPDDPNILYEIASAQLYAGRIQDAIGTYDQLEKKSGPFEELSLQKHQLWLQLNQFEKAGLELEKLAIAFPDMPRYWGMAAQFYTKFNLPEKAKSAMDQMVMSDPNNGEVHLQLSEYYAVKGDDKKSYEELRKAFQTTDISIDQKVNVLLKYFSLTDFNPAYLPQAYELLELTEKMNSSEAKTYSIYGDFLYRDGRDEEALVKYRKAVELDKGKSLIFEQILAIENEIGSFADMLKESTQAIELFPNQPQFYFYQGVAYYKKRDFTKALEALNYGKEIVVDNNALLSQFYSTLGEVYHYQGDHEKSDANYEKALKVQPDNVYVLNNYSYYLALRKTKLERAAEMALRANTLVPGQGSFEDTYAYILFVQGNYQEALTWIEKSIEHSDESGELLEHYGDILIKLNRTNDAITNWKAAKELGGTSNRIDQKIAEQKYIE